MPTVAVSGVPQIGCIFQEVAQLILSVLLEQGTHVGGSGIGRNCIR